MVHTMSKSKVILYLLFNIDSLRIREVFKFYIIL